MIKSKGHYHTNLQEETGEWLFKFFGYGVAKYLGWMNKWMNKWQNFTETLTKLTEYLN